MRILIEKHYRTILKKFNSIVKISFSNKTFYLKGLDNFDNILNKDNINKNPKRFKFNININFQ